MKLVVATRNRGKVKELAKLLDGLGLELVALSDYPDAPEVDETGATYTENARLKAVSACRHTGEAALADDSGLEVDALDGKPGLRSARFAEDNGNGSGDDANIDTLLAKLDGVPEERRGARFRCVLVLALPGGDELVAEGTCEGVVTESRRGGNGFGYDPVLFHPPSNATFGELTTEEKQRISHRAAAAEELQRQLRGRLGR